MSLQDTYPLILGALCVWREARGENYISKLGVWWVIKNRAAALHIPDDTIAAVVTRPKQFSSFNQNDPNVIQYPRALDHAWLDCLSVVEGVDTDPTGGATNYHSLPDGVPWPNWADPKKLTVTIGKFKFYKL